MLQLANGTGGFAKPTVGMPSTFELALSHKMSAEEDLRFALAAVIIIANSRHVPLRSLAFFVVD